MMRHLANAHSVTGPASSIYRMFFLALDGTGRANGPLDRMY